MATKDIQELELELKVIQTKLKSEETMNLALEELCKLHVAEKNTLRRINENMCRYDHVPVKNTSLDTVVEVCLWTGLGLTMVGLVSGIVANTSGSHGTDDGGDINFL